MSDFFLGEDARMNKLGFEFFLEEGNRFVGNHCHKEVELIYVIDGEIPVGVNGHFYALTAGEFIIFDSGMIHAILLSKESRRLVLQFDMDTLRIDMSSKKCIENYSFPSTALPINEKLDITSVLEEIVLCKQLAGTIQELSAMAGIYKLIGKLVMYSKEKLGEKYSLDKDVHQINFSNVSERMRKIFEYVEKYYGEKITLDQMAHHLNLDKFYFAKFFKKYTGDSFYEFLTDYRLNKAKWKIINENSCISEIVTECGFGSTKSFYYHFNKKIGISPSRYKRQYIGKTQQI